ncbi:MAG TPA: hypothetical protein PKU97_13185 [Kofleriaceae bacterium]|nr:hypothetical protein [Kofleriaceae bacterium]
MQVPRSWLAALVPTAAFLASCGAAPPVPSAATSAPLAPAAAAAVEPVVAGASAAPSLSPAVCEGPGRRRDFDFWIGAWEVRGAKGAVVGENRIEPIHGGCALLESWASSDGGAGSSWNFYDPVRKKWRQVWLDRTAGIIELEGALVGSAMVLEGTSLQPNGTLGKMRGTWTPLPDGKVRQVFEESSDGATWKITFDGLYSRKP